jgi:hypothetical protein
MEALPTEEKKIRKTPQYTLNALNAYRKRNLEKFREYSKLQYKKNCLEKEGYRESLRQKARERYLKKKNSVKISI